MKKFWIQIISLLIVIFAALFVSFNPQILNGNFNLNWQNISSPVLKKQLIVKNVIIDVEIVDNEEKRKVGLRGREKLPWNEGMLFVFPEEKKYRFWMKGMNFPLDFIFINNGKVVDVLKTVPNPDPSQKDETLSIYEPIVPIGMMLEVNAGFVDQYGIVVGDNISLTE